MRVFLALTLVPAAGSLSISVSPVAASATSRSTVVDGVYRVVSTDCYFSGGRCRDRFDIEQVGDKLVDHSDRYFRGHVRGERVTISEVYPPGVGEDSWWASGRTMDGGATFSGTFTDGIGGSGTFTATRIGG
jgi:hypothetical protein